VTCATGTAFKTNAASIIPDTKQTDCCDTACSAHECGPGYHLKSNAADIAGAVDNLCCDRTKCSGNTPSRNDVTCGPGKLLKSQAGSIYSTVVDDCCDTSCEGFDCGTGRTLVEGPESVKGSYDAACCRSDPCENYDCEAMCLPAASTDMVCSLGTGKRTAAYGSTLHGFDHCTKCCDIVTESQHGDRMGPDGGTSPTSFAANGAELSFVGLGTVWGLNFC
jgi:hypothetical protein